MADRTDRYVVSVVHGHMFDPKRNIGRGGLSMPCEASVLDSCDGYRQVAAYPSGGGRAPADVIARAEKHAHLLNRDERRWENSRDPASLPDITVPAVHDEGLGQTFPYLCEHCPAKVPLTRPEFDDRRGRIVCDACSAHDEAA